MPARRYVSFASVFNTGFSRSFIGQAGTFPTPMVRLARAASVVIP